MSIFNHDLIPHILRTKPLLELEEKEAIILRVAKDFEQRKNGEVCMHCNRQNFKNIF
jgi:hypothetical protein